jgi:hypothetical protein
MAFKFRALTFNKILSYVTLILGLLVSVFFSIFLIADSIGDIVEGKYRVIPIFLLMINSVAGYIWTFSKPKRGGLVMITGGIIMSIYLLFVGGFSEINMSLIFGLPFIVPGLIYFFCWKRIGIM